MNVEEIIGLQKNLESQDGVLRSRWQNEANYIFPRESNITVISTPGTRNKITLYDTTAVTESDNMVSGLLTNLVPAGQKFFSLTTSNNEIAELDVAKSYMAKATETTHEELFSSNYILQLTETLRSLVVFGTGNSFSEYQNGLNFTDWDISRYQILENFRGQIDTVFIKFSKTAKQAVQKWGEDAVGEAILKAYRNTKTINDKFWFIHFVGPREVFNPRFEDNMNMSFESKYIAVKDKIPLEEGGFPEFPYAVSRWTKTTSEAHGRGIGTMILPQVQMVNINKRDFNECGNKHVNPAMDVKQSFEGTYKTYPGARNTVMELPSSEPVGRGMVNGNFPISKDSIEFEREVIIKAFYGDAFAPITSTGTGDRRNELEIRQRVMEAFRRIGSPIGRLESEHFTPQLTRCVGLLIRNGKIPEPPKQLQGQGLKIVYLGPLSLAQQSSEVSASQQWIGTIKEMEESEAFAGASDNVNVDKSVRRMGRVFGVNEDDIATKDEVKAKREARQAAIEKQQALEAAQVAAGAYGQTTKAPEAGSAAEQLQEVAG